MDTINYKNLFEKSTAVLLVLNTKYFIVSVSDAYCTITQCKREAILGNHIFDHFPAPPNDVKSKAVKDILDSFKQVIKYKVPYKSTMLLRYLTKKIITKGRTSNPIFCKPLYTPILDEFNEVKYILIQIEHEDITKKIAVNEKNYLPHQQLHKKDISPVELLPQTPFAIAILKGKEMYVSEANNIIKKIWGKRKSLTGKPILEIFPVLKDSLFPHLLDNVLTTGIPIYGDHHLVELYPKKKLVNIYANYIYQPYLEADGVISGVTIIAYASENVVSSKKIADIDLRFRSLIQESSVAIGLYIGPDMHIEYVNEQMLSYWGKNKTILEKTLAKALPELKGQPFFSILQGVYTTGITYSGVEEETTLLVKGKLQTLYFNFTFKALRDKDDIIYGIQHMSIDVTNEVNTKNKLKESEKRYKSLAKSTTTVIWISNAAGEFFEPQLSWEKYTGQSWAKHKAHGWINMVHKSDRKRIIRNWKLAQIQGTAFKTSGKLWSQHHNDYRYAESVGISFADELGNIKEWVGTITDINDNKLANIKIAESEKRFRLLVAQAPVAICVLRGKNYVIETINAGMAEMWGKKIEQVQDKPAFEVIPELKNQGFKTRLDNVFKTGKGFVAQEIPINLNRNGNPVIIFIKFIYEPLRDAEGIVTGVMALAHDITEQVMARKGVEESEKKFRLLTNTMPQKINTADVDGNVTYYNQKWLDDTGYSYEELKNWGWQKAMFAEDIAKTIVKWQESLATGNPFEIEYRLLEKGVYRWNLSRALPLKDDNGKIIMWVGTHTDIQHIKEEQEQKDNFIGKVSHELRTPVAIIKTYSQLLQQILIEKNNLAEAKILSKIEAQLKRLNNLVMDLLDVTKVNSGTLSVNKTIFDFNQLVSTTVAHLQTLAPKNNIRLHLEAVGLAYSDEERIIQVLTNLLINAIKYSNADSAIIVATSIVATEIILSVQDFGIGIPQNEQQHIFKQFHRVSGPLQHTYPGLGLGLFISAEIIQQLNGRIWAISQPGKGSTFYFALPNQLT